MMALRTVASSSSKSNSLPHAMHSPLGSMALEGQSSLNSALANASEAAESKQAENEEVAEEQKWGGESKSINGSIGHDIYGGIEGGLQSQSSRLSSNPMGYILEGDEMPSFSASEPFETSELELIEAALTTFRSVEQQFEAPEAGEQINASSNDQQGRQSVARLLHKVQAVKARKTGTSLQHTRSTLVRSSMQGPPGGEDLDSADIRRVVQAAAETALAAAKTAETVVSSLNRNSQAMEALCKVLTGTESLPLPAEETAQEVAEVEEGGSESSDNEAKFLAIELQQTEIAKSLVRQNRVTHWVLGFIVVSSLVWRYGVVKFVKKVNNTIQNPFQGFTDRFFPKSEENQTDSEQSLPQFRLPGILGGEDETEHRKRHAKQEGDDSFNLGDILPGEEPERCKEVKKQAKQATEDVKFNLSNIFPGQNSNSGRSHESHYFLPIPPPTPLLSVNFTGCNRNTEPWQLIHVSPLEKIPFTLPWYFIAELW